MVTRYPRLSYRPTVLFGFFDQPYFSAGLIAVSREQHCDLLASLRVTRTSVHNGGCRVAD